MIRSRLRSSKDHALCGQLDCDFIHRFSSNGVTRTCTIVIEIFRINHSDLQNPNYFGHGLYLCLCHTNGTLNTGITFYTKPGDSWLFGCPRRFSAVCIFVVSLSFTLCNSPRLKCPNTAEIHFGKFNNVRMLPK